MTVTPQQLAAAVKANVEFQANTVAAEVTKMVYEKLAVRVNSLHSGVEDNTPSDFRVSIPAKYLKSKPTKAGVEQALLQLQQAGFDVAFQVDSEVYADDSYYFDFKA